MGKVPLDQGLDVLVFEGWCLGFKPLTKEGKTDKWEQAKKSSESSLINTLADHGLSHLDLINANLSRYCDSFAGPQHFDGFLHLSTDDLAHVY